MAKGHRYLGPLWVVLPDDSAVDQQQSDPVKYHTSLFKDGLVLLEGQKPTRFEIAPLTVRQKRYAVTKDLDIDLILRCGLIKIENYIIEQSDGSIVPPQQPDRKDRGGELGCCASSEWIDNFPLHMADRRALASMILTVTEPDPLSCKPSDGQFGGSRFQETESAA